MGTVKVGAPMERITFDLMGPLYETERHNHYILVVSDYFSKWVEAYAIPNQEATTVADKIALSGCAGTGLHTHCTVTRAPTLSWLCFRRCAGCWGLKRHTPPHFAPNLMARWSALMTLYRKSWPLQLEDVTGTGI